MKFRVLTTLAIAAALALPAIALGTFSTQLHYHPPKIKILDYFEHGTAEDLTIARQGPVVRINNEGGMAIVNPDPPGCEFVANAYECPLAGVTKFVAILNGKPDIARIDMPGSASIRQALNGGGGGDRLLGSRGKQILKGHTGNDVLRGGEGPDVLVGGRGDDTCVGGPGNDILRDCE